MATDEDRRAFDVSDMKMWSEADKKERRKGQATGESDSAQYARIVDEAGVDNTKEN